MWLIMENLESIENYKEVQDRNSLNPTFQR